MAKRFYRPTPAGNGVYAIGFACLAAWLLTLKLPEAPIFRLLDAFAANSKVEELILASALLVALNTLRAIPLYVGCFYLGEGLGRYGALLPLTAIPMGYYAFELLSGGKGHHFGIPSIMGIVFILQLLTWKVPGRLNRAAALCLFLFSFQWLNLAPYLTVYGFGQGELSLTIKNLAAILNLSPILNLLGLGGFALSFIGAALSTALLVNIVLNVRQFRRLMRQNELLATLREGSLRARMANEIQGLVHDLRRPLTSIQGLTDVLAATAVSPESREHAEHAGAAAETMNRMIDEILHEDGRSRIRAAELLDYTLSQVSPLPWHRSVRTECPPDLPSFFGNKVRISRALANLMENAAHAAASSPEPRILVQCYARGGSLVFSVRDNGPGIPQDFAIGASGYGSTGLGLTVVQKVAENHGGSFTLRNHPQGGAEALLALSLERGAPRRKT